AGGGCRAHGGALGLGIEQPLERERRDAERHRNGRSEERRVETDLADVHEHPGPQLPAAQRGDVLAQRHLVLGPTFEVAPDGRIDLRRRRVEKLAHIEERVHCYDSSAARRKTSAAASWNPAGRSLALMLSAISSISPIQRQ